MSKIDIFLQKERSSAMIRFLSINTLLFTSLFFSTLLPMDPRPKRQKRNILALNQDQNSNTSLVEIAWGNMDKKREQLGDLFALLPKDILWPYFLIKSDPSTKNGLRKTNKIFRYHLSWENRQPFMMCPELCASDRDFNSIIIQLLYPYTAVCKKPMKPEDQSLIEALKQKLTTPSYPIAGSIDDKFERFELGLVSSDSPTPPSIFLINNHEKSDVRSSELISTISPLLIACIARNPHEVKKYLRTLSIPEHKITDIQRALHLVIQNDDIHSLEILLNNQTIRSIATPLLFKFLLLSIFTGSHKTNFFIYKLCRGQALASLGYNVLDKQKDFIASWLGVIYMEGLEYDFRSIIDMHHAELSERHKNNITGYHGCLSNIYSKQQLKKFNPPVEIMDSKKDKKDKKSIKKSIKAFFH